MRYVILVVLLTSCACASADEWKAPKNPDLAIILEEAHNDTRAKRYETALAKHVWFHENVLAVDPAYSGVRLSFALSYWLELAQKYPPAMEKLKQTRDRNAEEVSKGGDIRKSFNDMTAINKTLGEESLTKKAFEALDRERPDAAKQVFDAAKPALVRGKAYELCGKYVQPDADLDGFITSYRLMKRLADEAPIFREQQLEFAEKKFANDVSTLVAILAVNQRQAEAERIAEVTRKESNDAKFHRALKIALTGVVPEPWP